MSNLFSVFDPNVINGLALNWLSTFFILWVIPRVFWLAWSQAFTIISIMVNFVYGEFLAIAGKTIVPGALLLYVRVFAFIGANNFFGLVPYIFTSSRHLTFSVALALPLWIGHTTISWIKTTNSALAHLVPSGTPYALMPFIVLIELTRNIIRPLTLSVRLAANIVAGHLLLTLLRVNSPSLTVITLSLIVGRLVLLCMLETAVAIIQAYVFSVLRTLYLNEVNSTAINH